MGRNIKNNIICYGCSACVNICPQKAIKMESDSFGFLYPQVNEKCINCGLCLNVCPIYIKEREKELESPKVYAVKHLNEEVYMRSSSGGMFLALCQYIIENNGIVYGAVYNKSFQVIHDRRTTLKGCADFCGSKYVQSNIEGVYSKVRKDLQDDKWVLFSGTPCQVDGLLSFLRIKYNKLLTCDLLCHGVPSPKLFQEYISFVSNGKKLESINMKSKTKGELGTAIQFKYTNGSIQRKCLKTDLWNKLYFEHYVLRESCYSCQYTNYNRVGDITIGDFWGIKRSEPVYDNTYGVSLVLINSEKGR